jgi:hypothetical protein
MLLSLSQIIPADLNAFLYQLERNIAWAANHQLLTLVICYFTVLLLADRASGPERFLVPAGAQHRLGSQPDRQQQYIVHQEDDWALV